MVLNSVRRVVVIGAGDSGRLAAHLFLKSDAQDLRVVLIERSAAVVRALKARTVGTGGAHGAEILSPYISADPGRPGRLHVIEGQAQSISFTQRGLAVELSDGTSCGGHLAVLATGRDPAMVEDAVYTVPCDAEKRIPPAAAVMGIGTNLTLVNCLARMIERGHSGPLYAISAHGLLPLVEEGGAQWMLDKADIPFGTGVTYFLRWLRESIRWASARGVDWRQFVDALQPFSAEIWQHLPQEHRRRFMRHASGLWDAHRDRMSSHTADVITRAMLSGQLQVIAGTILTTTADTKGALVEVASRGRGATKIIKVDKIVQRKGAHRELLGSRNPVVKSLIDQGLARPDPAALGLEVTIDSALVDQRGIASSRLHAVGSASRAAIWDIMGPPTPIEQCEGLLDQLLYQQRSAKTGSTAV